MNDCTDGQNLRGGEVCSHVKHFSKSAVNLLDENNYIRRPCDCSSDAIITNSPDRLHREYKAKRRFTEVFKTSKASKSVSNYASCELCKWFVQDSFSVSSIRSHYKKTNAGRNIGPISTNELPSGPFITIINPQCTSVTLYKIKYKSPVHRGLY